LFLAEKAEKSNFTFFGAFFKN